MSQNNLDRLSTAYERNKNAKINRKIQLQHWNTYDAQMNAKENNCHIFTKKNNQMVKFSDQCILLESTLRGDIKEGIVKSLNFKIFVKNDLRYLYF